MAYTPPTYERKRVKDLTADEKDRLLEEILEHLGRDIEYRKYDGDANGIISLVKLRSC